MHTKPAAKAAARKKLSKAQSKRWARKPGRKVATTAHVSNPAAPGSMNASVPGPKPVTNTVINKPSPAVAKEQENQ